MCRKLFQSLLYADIKRLNRIFKLEFVFKIFYNRYDEETFAKSQLRQRLSLSNKFFEIFGYPLYVTFIKKYILIAELL